MKRLVVVVALLALLALALLLPAALLAQDGGLTLEGLAWQIEKLFANQGELAARVAALEARVPPPLPDDDAPLPVDSTPTAAPTPQPGPTGPPPDGEPGPTPHVTPGSGSPPAEPPPDGGAGPAPTPVLPKPEDAPPTVLEVRAARANVYSGPGSHHDVIEVVTKGDTFPGPLTEVDGWYYFCCVAHEVLGWISRPLVAVLNTDEIPAWQAARSAALEVELEALLRYNEDYLGKEVYLGGVQVLQAMDDALLVVIPAEGWVESAWLLYENGTPRVLTRDRIEFVAQVAGLHRFDTTFGVSVTMPLLRVVALRVVE